MHPITGLIVGAAVRHKVLANRGTGKVLEVGRTYLRSQTPKLHVGFERGGPLWCYPDDLTVVPALSASGPRPTLTVIDHAPAVA